MSKRFSFFTVHYDVLAFVEEFGGGIDFGGKGSSRARLDAAIELINAGMLQGSARNVSLTAQGIRALKRYRKM